MNITGGKYKGRKVIAPDEKITRPTLSKTRMGIFNTLYSILGEFEGKSFLDVFGGSGIMGLEALSRGFEKVKVCELNRKSAEIIKKNYASLGINADLKVGDSVKFLKKSDELFDVVFIDPPYKSGLYEDVLSSVKGKIIIVEHDSHVEFKNFVLLKQKKYSSSTVSFIAKIQ